MELYKNLSGNSGVVAYELGDRSIKVQFGDRVYKYTYESAGAEAVEQMKGLALAGQGLASFISANVKKAYASVSEDA